MESAFTYNLGSTVYILSWFDLNLHNSYGLDSSALWLAKTSQLTNLTNRCFQSSYPRLKFVYDIDSWFSCYNRISPVKAARPLINFATVQLP